MPDCKRTLKLYDSAEGRFNHEMTHDRTYKCTDCKSVPNGFKSINALRKHREKYHMKPEDFGLPSHLVNITGKYLNMSNI